MGRDLNSYLSYFLPKHQIIPPMNSKASTLARKATLGAAATGAVFGLQHQVDAAVVYSGLQNKIVTNGMTDINVDGAGLGDLRLIGFTGANELAGLNGAQVLNSLGSVPALRKLALGASIWGNAPGIWANQGRPFYQFVPGSTSSFLPLYFSFGQWAEDEVAFGAFRLNAGNGNFNYGWVRLQWEDQNSDGYADKITALDWAYEDTVNTSILAGAVPEPARALLTLAGLGALALRRRRKI